MKYFIFKIKLIMIFIFVLIYKCHLYIIAMIAILSDIIIDNLYLFFAWYIKSHEKSSHQHKIFISFCYITAYLHIAYNMPTP